MTIQRSIDEICETKIKVLKVAGRLIEMASSQPHLSPDQYNVALTNAVSRLRQSWDILTKAQQDLERIRSEKDVGSNPTKKL